MSISLKYITDTHGERTEVILPVQEYEQMLEEMQILRARAMRKDLLSLSPTEREDILKQQTNGMVDFYQTDTEWRELDQVNDIHDYDE
jgi:hypothetical protein